MGRLQDDRSAIVRLEYICFVQCKLREASQRRTVCRSHHPDILRRPVGEKRIERLQDDRSAIIMLEQFRYFSLPGYSALDLKAGDLVAAVYIPQRRPLLTAIIRGKFTAGMKMTARRRVCRAGHFTLQNDTVAFLFKDRIGYRHR
jgi:hypothetical protein